MFGCAPTRRFPIGVSDREVESLNPGQRQRLAKALKTINCNPGDLRPNEFKEAWAVFGAIVSQIAVPAAIWRLKQEPSDSPSRRLLEEEPSQDGGMLAILMEYLRFHPDFEMKEIIQGMTPILASAKACFSSQRYDFPRKELPDREEVVVSRHIYCENLQKATLAMRKQDTLKGLVSFFLWEEKVMKLGRYQGIGGQVLWQM